jgi:hypothetical protein
VEKLRSKFEDSTMKFDSFPAICCLNIRFVQKPWH